MKHFHAHSGLTQGLKVLLNNHTMLVIPLVVVVVVPFRILLPIRFDEKI